MVLIDTHTHLYSDKFNEDRSEAIESAIQAGVQRFYMPNIDSASIAGMFALEEEYPGKCFAMMGLHPCSVKGNFRDELKVVEGWLEKRPFAAIGEIGLDYYWDTSYAEAQKEAFRLQIRWAKELELPIVVHSRDSIEDIITILQEENDDRLTGILHCFTGLEHHAEALVEMGFHIGIGGVITFKNGGLDKVLPSIPLDRVVLETDAPYLAPSPYRGKRNESKYVPIIAQKVADVYERPVEEIAKITTENAMQIFWKYHEQLA